MRKYNSNKKIHKEEAKEKRKTKEEAEKLEAERKAAKERIENKIKEVEESIEKIENNGDKKVAEASSITFTDKLNRLLSEKQEETNERIIALQKDYYTAECELAKSVLERFKVELDCKKDLLDFLKQNLKDLENTKEINSLWETMSNKEAEANSKLKEAQRLYDEAKRARDEADKILREANEKEQENNRIKKELEEQKEMQAREQQRLDEEKKKIEEEKNKGFFSGAWEKVSNFSPVKKIEEKFNECIVEPLKYYGHKALVGCKIALGVVAVVIAAKTIKPIVDLCTSIKKFFQTKSKKVVPQKPSNSTSATPV